MQNFAAASPVLQSSNSHRVCAVFQHFNNSFFKPWRSTLLKTLCWGYIDTLIVLYDRGTLNVFKFRGWHYRTHTSIQKTEYFYRHRVASTNIMKQYQYARIGCLWLDPNCLHSLLRDLSRCGAYTGKQTFTIDIDILAEESCKPITSPEIVNGNRNGNSAL